ncbi:hypothetical protein U1Q18_020244 [Sarracenia purpurea var. burkii]
MTSVEAPGTRVLTVCAAPDYCPGQISSFFRDSRDSSARLVGQKKMYRGRFPVSLLEERSAISSFTFVPKPWGMLRNGSDLRRRRVRRRDIAVSFRRLARHQRQNSLPECHSSVCFQRPNRCKALQVDDDFFAKAKGVGMMSEGYAWIVTDAAANALGLLDPSAIDSMQGVLGVEPYVPTTKQLANFTNRWRTKFQRKNPTIINAELVSE